MITGSSGSKRSNEEYIIMFLSGACSLGVLPFVVFRLLQRDWAVAALDLFAVLATFSLFLYVFVTHKTKTPSRILAFLVVLVVFITVYLKGSDQLMWVYPSLTAIFFLLPANFALLFSTLYLISFGVVLHQELTLLLAMKFYVSAVTTMLFSYAFANRMRKQKQQLTLLATEDPLTGAGNRRAMEKNLVDVLAFQQRNQTVSASLILIDLDNFKRVNDTLGHRAGDEILINFVKTISARIRATDKLYRYGGEEFVIIADNTPLKEAATLAEDLRNAVETEECLKKHGVTISVGTAVYEPLETAFDWLGRADKAMYKAKSQGRNTCCVA